MKTCPTCYRKYADDSLAFCLDDGSSLLPSPDSEATRIMPPTVPRPTMASAPPQTQQARGQTFSSQAIAGSRGKNNPLLYVIIGLLALIAGGGLVALLLLGRGATTNNQPANVAANTQTDPLLQEKQDVQNRQAELDRERQRLEDERKKLESEKGKSTDNTAPSVDSSARINFRRGSVQETISGVVAHSKSYVLKAKAGQSLSASITSNGCAVFNSGSNSATFVTANGDNWITVINNCGGQVPFNLTVNVR